MPVLLGRNHATENNSAERIAPQPLFSIPSLKIQVSGPIERPLLTITWSSVAMRSNIPSLDSILVDSREAARRLGISTRTLWTLTDRGELLAVRIGRLVRYRPDALRLYAERQEGGDK